MTLNDQKSANADEEKSTQSSKSLAEPYEGEGDLAGWLTVAGGWFILFGTFGYLYSFGVYQDYYTRIFLSEHSTSKIAWIGSFQLMLPFLLGVVSGKLFDLGYFHVVEITGSVIFIICLFLSSLAKPQQYVQIFLSQGLGMGIGVGLTFIPSVSIAIHHFRRRKAFATGIIMSGSSIGAVIFPIMINKLLPRIGFGPTVRASAYIVLGTLILGNCLVRTAYHRMNNLDRPPLKITSFLRDPPFIASYLGALVALFGFYFPLIYMQLYAITHGIDANLAFYSIAIMNAASTVGRVLGNYVADILGPYTVVIPCTIISSASIFAVLGVNNSGSLIAVSIVYGLFAGAWLSLSVAGLATTARHPSETGARIGLALALSSFGTLGAAPVQGALLTSTFEWKKPIIFSGVLMAAAAGLFGVGRQYYVYERGTQRV